MNSSKNSHAERPPLSRRTYALLALGFLAFVIYGSLVPFHWHVLSWGEALLRWQEVCARPVRVYSLSDWVTNVLLFVPAGYLLMAVGCVDRHRMIGVAAAPLVLALCTAFSSSVEFSQLFFPPRDSSLSDVTANALGSSAGILTWLALGQPLTEWLRKMWAVMAERGLSAQLLPGYLAFLFLVHLMPLDLTIRPADLYHKYKQGRVHLIPFEAEAAAPEQLIGKTIWTVTLFLPVGVLLARLRGSGWRKGRGWPRVLAAGFATAGAIEFAQLFVYSRNYESGDLIVGALAVLAGWRAQLAWHRGPFDSGRAVFRSAAGLPDVRWFLLATWLGILAFLNWQPFDFITHAAEASRRLHAMSFVPFADYQATSAEHAFEECLHKIVVFLPLGGLLAWAMGAVDRTRSVIPVVLVGGLIAVTLEVGQLFLHSRYASVTDVLIETGGVWLGCQIVRQMSTRHPSSAVLSWSTHEYRR